LIDVCRLKPQWEERIVGDDEKDADAETETVRTDSRSSAPIQPTDNPADGYARHDGDDADNAASASAWRDKEVRFGDGGPSMLAEHRRHAQISTGADDNVSDTAGQGDVHITADEDMLFTDHVAFSEHNRSDEAPMQVVDDDVAEAAADLGTVAGENEVAEEDIFAEIHTHKRKHSLPSTSRFKLEGDGPATEGSAKVAVGSSGRRNCRKQPSPQQLEQDPKADHRSVDSKVSHGTGVKSSRTSTQAGAEDDDLFETTRGLSSGQLHHDDEDEDHHALVEVPVEKPSRQRYPHRGTAIVVDVTDEAASRDGSAADDSFSADGSHRTPRSKKSPRRKETDDSNEQTRSTLTNSTKKRKGGSSEVIDEVIDVS
jgi:hypothetical protein